MVVVSNRAVSQKQPNQARTNAFNSFNIQSNFAIEKSIIFSKGYQLKQYCGVDMNYWYKYKKLNMMKLNTVQHC